MTVNRTRRTVLASCCGAHTIQDGLVALQYVLLPVLAQIFGLSYAQVGMLRAISSSSAALLELPSGILAERFGERRLLALGLVGAGTGYLGVALAPNFHTIAFFFLIAGAGAAFQHSLASSLVVKAFEGAARRRALGTYNSLGDGGKLAFTGLFSVGIGAGLAWNVVVVLLAIVAIVFGIAIWFVVRRVEGETATEIHSEMTTSDSRWGIIDQRRFSALGLVVFLDCTVQAVFLTFLAFVLLEKGVSPGIATGSVVLALSGGMVGKFCCGFLAARIGDWNAFRLIQVLTVIGIAGLILLPATMLLILLPIIGLAIQGSSTITYGSVADFVHRGRQSRGYALIYSLATASYVMGPFLFGFIADQAGLANALWMLIPLIIVTLPLSVILASSPREVREIGR